MAKAKPKAKKKAPRKAPRKAAPKKAVKKAAKAPAKKSTGPREVASKGKIKTSEGSAAKSKGPVAVVRNHRFPPDTEVGFHPAHSVETERNLGREPFSAPVATAKVKARGLLEVGGLSKGQWCASGQVGDRYLYVQFSTN